jgi:CBS domain-containing protein
MTSPVHTLSPDSYVATAAALMRRHRHHHVVVLEGQKIVGIVSSLDLLGLLEASSGSVVAQERGA